MPMVFVECQQCINGEPCTGCQGWTEVQPEELVAQFEAMECLVRRLQARDNIWASGERTSAAAYKASLAEKTRRVGELERSLEAQVARVKELEKLLAESQEREENWSSGRWYR